MTKWLSSVPFDPDAVIDDERRDLLDRVARLYGDAAKEDASDLLSYAGDSLREIAERCPTFRRQVEQAVRDAYREQFGEVVYAAERDAKRVRFGEGNRLGKDPEEYVESVGRRLVTAAMWLAVSAREEAVAGD